MNQEDKKFILDQIEELKKKINRISIGGKRSEDEYCVFVYMRGNDFNGLKLNPDGSIICSVIKDKEDGRDIPETKELTIEVGWGDESNSEAYHFMSDIFSDGDVLRIVSSVENGEFDKKVEKVMDKEFCLRTLESWNKIKHMWFHPEEASKRLEDHIKSLQ